MHGPVGRKVRCLALRPGRGSRRSYNYRSASRPAHHYRRAVYDNSIKHPCSGGLRRRLSRPMLEALLVSTVVVALGELGDKTQLLTLVLAARFRKPWPIIAGILVATLVNHTIAGVGRPLGARRGPARRPALGARAVVLRRRGVGAQARPVRRSPTPPPASNRSVFAVTVVAFFLAEIGDKTQIATAMLAAQFAFAGRRGRRHDARHAARRRADGVHRRRGGEAHSVSRRAHRRRRALRRSRRVGAGGPELPGKPTGIIAAHEILHGAAPRQIRSRP